MRSPDGGFRRLGEPFLAGYRRPACASQIPDRIKAEIDRKLFRVEAALCDERSDERGGEVCGERRRLEREFDEVEHDPAERLLEVRKARQLQAEAACRRRAFEDEGEPSRAALKVSDEKLVCERRVRVVHPLHHPPRRCPGDQERSCPFRLRVERLDLKPLVTSRDERLVEIGSLDRALDELEPALAGGDRKLGIKVEGGH